MNIIELIPTARVLTARKIQEPETAVIARQSHLDTETSQQTLREGRNLSEHLVASVSDARLRICCVTVKTRHDPNQHVSDVARQSIL